MNPSIRVRAATLISSCVLLGSGCFSNLLTPPTLAETGIDAAKCEAAKQNLDPLIVEWAGTEKVALDATSQRGVVVVAYEGCSLRVLRRCNIQGSYEMGGVTPSRDKRDIKSQDDLYAYLPLGVATLSGELSQGRQLALDYVATGQRSYEGEAPTLGDGCDGATHYVKRIMVGAYKLDTLATGKASAEGNVLFVEGGAKHSESDQRRKTSGDPDVCEKDPTAVNCGAPIQLELVAIAGAAAKPR